MFPRRLTFKPGDEEYNKVIRLEGQIQCIQEILRFRWRYQELPNDDEEALLSAAREWYLSVIEEFRNDFLYYGTDLYGAKSLDHLIFRVRKEYFRHMPKEEREEEHHWPRLFWLQKLQGILEDESISLEQSLVRGWHWFMEPGQYPAKYLKMAPSVEVWRGLSAARQAQFLQFFSINPKTLDYWLSEIKSMNLRHPDLIVLETEGLKSEYLALNRRLDVHYPKLVNPTRQRLPACMLCNEQLLKEDIGTTAEHRPMETPCGDIFGYKCLRKWFEKELQCPKCERSLLWEPHHDVKPEELLQSCDRILKWVEVPSPLPQLPEPHSCLSRLALIFEPANEIREQMDNWVDIARTAHQEQARLYNLGLYLARERFAAVVEGDVLRFREVVLQQAEAGARRQWLSFLIRCHPEAP